MNHIRLQNDALWSVIAQCIVIIILSPLVLILWHYKATGSFLLGGTICVLPNIYLYRRLFEHFGARAAKKIVKAFYLGEVIKLVLTAAGFVGALLIPWVLPLWVFVGYIIAQAGFWIAPLVSGLLRNASKRRSQSDLRIRKHSNK